jgi:hypothetical protein
VPIISMACPLTATVVTASEIAINVTEVALIAYLLCRSARRSS